jgi:Ca2+-binding EF-hand superfamily protein
MRLGHGIPNLKHTNHHIMKSIKSSPMLFPTAFVLGFILIMFAVACQPDKALEQKVDALSAKLDTMQQVVKASAQYAKAPMLKNPSFNYLNFGEKSALSKKEYMNNVDEIFNNYFLPHDKNKDGNITFEEYRQLYYRKQYVFITNKMDTDQDGLISEKEFFAYKEISFDKALVQLDKDKDAAFSRSEDADEFRLLFEKIDQNKDESITREEVRQAPIFVSLSPAKGKQFTNWVMTQFRSKLT